LKIEAKNKTLLGRACTYYIKQKKFHNRGVIVMCGGLPGAVVVVKTDCCRKEGP